MKKNQLLALIRNNSSREKKPPPLVVKNEGKTTVYVYDVIGQDWSGGIDSGEFVRELVAIDAPEIHVRIDSPGGDVFAARAMQTALAEHPARVVAHIDGLAASAATFLAMAADEVRMSSGAFFMIHKGWTIAAGNANDFKKEAALLEKIDDAIAQDYANKTGKDKSELLSLMSDETWLSAADAKNDGFIDTIFDVTNKNGRQHGNIYDLSVYANAPADYINPVAPEKKDGALGASRGHIERFARLLNI